MYETEIRNMLANYGLDSDQINSVMDLVESYGYDQYREGKATEAAYQNYDRYYEGRD